MKPATANLEAVLAKLAQAGVRGKDMEGQGEALVKAMCDAVLAEVPSFTSSGNPEVRTALQKLSATYTGELMRLCTGGEVEELAAVKQDARDLAAQHFPLEAILHAYRCGHRVIAHWLRSTITARKSDAIPLTADLALEYTNAVSIIMASEYVREARYHAEAESDLRTELFNILLAGYDESDGRVAQLLKRAGYLEQRHSYCVVVAQPLRAQELEQPARAQRIVEALADVLSSTSIRLLSGQRDMMIVAVLSDRRRQSGWTAPGTDLAERLLPLLELVGPSVLIGLSASHPSTAFVPRAFHEAKIALDVATVARRIVRFSDLPIRDLLVHRASDYVQSAPMPWVQSLMVANAEAKGSLVETLRAMADADMNVQQAGRRLHKHANTVYARLERIREITGLDGQRYRDLTELLLAADCWRI